MTELSKKLSRRDLLKTAGLSLFGLGVAAACGEDGVNLSPPPKELL